MDNPRALASYKAGLAYALRVCMDEIKKQQAVSASQTEFPNGNKITTKKSRDRSAANAVWMQRYLDTLEKLAVVEGVPVKPRMMEEPLPPDEPGEFTFQFSGHSLPDLIRARNAGGDGEKTN
jgi:hypothetical protein